MKKTLLLLFVALSSLTVYNAAVAQNATDFHGIWTGQTASNQTITIKFQPGWHCDITINGVQLPEPVSYFRLYETTGGDASQTSGKLGRVIKFYTQDGINNVKCNGGNNSLSLTESVDKIYKGTALFDTNDMNTMILDVDFVHSPCTGISEPTQITFKKQ